MSKTRILYTTILAATVLPAAVAEADSLYPLKHRYGFDDLTDSHGLANGVAHGDAFTSSGQLRLNLSANSLRDGRVDLLANGINGININHYSSVTIEFWATPECDSAAPGCVPVNDNPNNGFSSVLGFGKTYGPPDLPVPEIGPTGAGADYIIMRTHTGLDVSRAAIAVTSEETLGAPWSAESGVDGPEHNDSQEHHYALVVDGLSLEWYVDGVLSGAAALGLNAHGNLNNLQGVSNEHVWIGSAYQIDPNWAGSMNELRIWEYPFSARHVADSFERGPDVLLPPCILCPEPPVMILLIGFAILPVVSRWPRGQHEAVELAERYGSANSAPFVNGILDKFLNRKDS